MGTNQTGSVAQIRVVGVGNGGCRVVNRMLQTSVMGIECIAIDTDVQALMQIQVPQRIHIGEKMTHGLGLWGNARLGNQAAQESKEEISKALSGSDVVFLTAGMGGGTGTGASPVVAQIAREMGALTIALVTMPFHFEDKNRLFAAEEGIVALSRSVDTLIAVPNDRLGQADGEPSPPSSPFLPAHDVLQQGMQAISDLISVPGLINLDVSDLKGIFSAAGSARLAIGEASGGTRALDAAREALASPLLDMDLSRVPKVLFNITGGTDLTLFEVSEAADVISRAAHPEATILFGAVQNARFDGKIKVTMIAMGFDGDSFNPLGNKVFI